MYKRDKGLSHFPRLVLSATQRSSGKTTICIGLCTNLRHLGLEVQTFKKGPDFIDPMWLGYAGGSDCHNLDLFMMGEEGVIRTFFMAGKWSGINLIEGNMGLYDSMDLEGQYSTSNLARVLNAPVVLVVDGGGLTRGIAPLVQGYQQFESDLSISGIILNKVAGSRHESKLVSAIRHYCGLEVIGVLPRMDEVKIKERHLGLIPIREDEELSLVVRSIHEAVSRYVDLDFILEIANNGALPIPLQDEERGEVSFSHVKIGIAKDRAFTFYYPENIEALRAAGAELIPFNTLEDAHLPQVDGLYIGGGFPELFLDELSSNWSLRREIKEAIEGGMPVYAECGGLMYLARRISWGGRSGEMVGALPCDIRIQDHPRGHGYVILRPTGHAEWFDPSGDLRGHEFHYSEVLDLGDVDFAYRVIRGQGIDGQHDGIIYKNVLALYTHLHSGGLRTWAQGFVRFVAECGCRVGEVSLAS